MKLKKLGIGMLALGILVLVTGIILAVTVGTRLVPILLLSSILINSVGIVLLQTHQKKK
ncbi:MAG: hypothetical protein LBV27_10070 [Oscillospiraceae bacterium]|jgi:hypothetical protein|nr:hypothetical protein [Oscillospiraceae bacterium]